MRRLCSLILSLVVSVVGLAAVSTPANAAPEPSPNGTYLVTLSDAAGAAGDVSGDSLGAEVVARYGHLGGVAVKATPAQAAALARNPLVATVEPDQIVHGDATQPAASWGLDRVDQRALPLDGNYTYDRTGAGVRLYIFDSGITPGHNEFVGRIVNRVGFLGSTTPTSDSVDCFGHGTHVAGTAAGTNTGVAKQATIFSLKILDCSNRGWSTDWVAAIDWVIGQHPAGQRAVANFSVSTDQPSSFLDAAISRLVAKGIVAVVSAGNRSMDACNGSPSRVREAITVAATGTTDQQSSFSNWGGCVDLYAPGEDILSAYYTSNSAYARMSGTSMSAPHVTGAVALKWEEYPTMTAAQVSAAVIGNSTYGAVLGAAAGTPNRLLYSRPGLGGPFLDVYSTTQFSSEIAWMASAGISTGWVVPGGREYRPLQPVNRDAMAAFMYRLAGSPAYTPPAVSPFVDVPTSNQFYKEISWLASRGISTGWVVPGGREYRPLQPVNRDAMAAFMYRLAGSPAYTPPAVSPFVDVRTTSQFYKEISWLAANQISTGWPVAAGREYRPLQPVLRDAMAAFMYRLKVTRRLV